MVRSDSTKGFNINKIFDEKFFSQRNPATTMLVSRSYAIRRSISEILPN